MRTATRLTGLLAPLASLLLASNSLALDLVKDGRPTATIVIAREANQLVRTAAEDLAFHVRLMTGATLPIAIDDQAPAAGVQVLIGASRLTEELGLKPEELPREGFRILCKGNTLAIVGKDRTLTYHHPNGAVRKVDEDPLSAFMFTQPATWFGVSHLLEKQFGVCWFWPGEDGIYYEKRQNLSVPEMDEIKAPPVTMRTLRSLWQGTWILKGFPKDILRESGYTDPKLLGKIDYGKPADYVRDFRVWERRMRLGVGGIIKASHADGWLIKEYWEKRPDFFAQRWNGKRRAPGEKRDVNAKLCVSNQDLIKLQQERGLEFFRRLREQPPPAEQITFDIGFQDSGGWCWCAPCKAMDEPGQRKGTYPVTWQEDGKWVEKKVKYPALSDRYVRYWNQIAEAVCAEFPQKLIGGLIYGAVGPAPVHARVHPNLVVPYTGASSLRANDPLPWVKKELERWFDAGLRNFYWRPNLMYFDYFALPFYYAEEGGELIKYMVQNGARGFDFDTWGNHFATDGVNIFVILRLMWDPDQDVNALVKEYCDKGFGKAGPLVHDYLMRCRAIREEIKVAKGIPSRNQDWVGKLGRFFDAEERAALDALAGQIKAASADDAPQFQKRVEVFLIGHQYTMLQAATIELTDKRNKSVAEFNELVRLVVKKEKWIENLGPTWAISTPLVRWHTTKNKFGPSVGYTYYESFRGKAIAAPLPERWKFFLDEKEVGDRLGLHTDKYDDSKLPHLSIYAMWEKQGYTEYNGHAWYRARFQAPEREEGRRYYLWFGAIDDGFWIYLNGQEVGKDFTTEERTHVWYTPYACEVTDQLKYGAENLVSVRVRDLRGGGGIYRGAFLLKSIKE